MHNLILFLALVLPSYFLYSYEYEEVVICEVVLESSNGRYTGTVEKVHFGDKLIAEQIVSRRIEHYEQLLRSNRRILVYHYKEVKPSFNVNERVRCFSWKIDNGKVVFVHEEGKKLIPLKEFVEALTKELKPSRRMI
jgi:hypothetical protein